MPHHSDIILEDTTLRDGEQAPGIAWSKRQKLALLRALIDAGVGSIEVGIPKMGGEELAYVSEALEYADGAQLVAWNRGLREDVGQSLALGYRAIHIGLPTSDVHLTSSIGRSRDWVVERGVSQLLRPVANSPVFRRLLRFVNLRKSEAEPEHPVLLDDGPGTGEAEALAQP